MINLDAMQKKKTDIMNALAESIRKNDETAMQNAMTEWSDMVQKSVIAEANGIMSAADTAILTARGVRQLTSKETKYYESIISQMKQEAKTITGIDKVMPETIFDSILDDISESHPLLNLIDFQNTTAITKMVVNKEGRQQAVWGALGSEISKELSGKIGLLETTLCKLTAFMYISKDMLELGPQWIDKYVRETLGEASATALETAIADGTGKDEPVGMTRNVADDVTVTAGVYPRKEAIAITSLDKITYGTILSMLTKTPTGRARTVSKIIAVCNPTDYFSKIMPATTLLLPDGTYRNNVLPFPTEIVQSVGVPAGKLIVGIADRYFMGIGTSKDGRIEYDDSYKFLDDYRTYTIKLFGNGRPLDNNAFILLDIENLDDTLPVVFSQNCNETRLSSLTVGNLTLSPAFDKNIIYYTAETSDATNTITAVSKDTEASVSIKNGSSSVTSGSAATWTSGQNTVKITVSNGGSSRTYTVVVEKS